MLTSIKRTSGTNEYGKKISVGQVDYSNSETDSEWNGEKRTSNGGENSKESFAPHHADSAAGVWDDYEANAINLATGTNEEWTKVANSSNHHRNNSSAQKPTATLLQNTNTKSRHKTAAERQETLDKILAEKAQKKLALTMTYGENKFIEFIEADEEASDENEEAGKEQKAAGKPSKPDGNAISNNSDDQSEEAKKNSAVTKSKSSSNKKIGKGKKSKANSTSSNNNSKNPNPNDDSMMIEGLETPTLSDNKHAAKTGQAEFGSKGSATTGNRPGVTNQESEAESNANNTPTTSNRGGGNVERAAHATANGNNGAPQANETNDDDASDDDDDDYPSYAPRPVYEAGTIQKIKARFIYVQEKGSRVHVTTKLYETVKTIKEVDPDAKFTSCRNPRLSFSDPLEVKNARFMGQFMWSTTLVSAKATTHIMCFYIHSKYHRLPELKDANDQQLRTELRINNGVFLKDHEEEFETLAIETAGVITPCTPKGKCLHSARYRLAVWMAKVTREINAAEKDETKKIREQPFFMLEPQMLHPGDDSVCDKSTVVLAVVADSHLIPTIRRILLHRPIEVTALFDGELPELWLYATKYSDPEQFEKMFVKQAALNVDTIVLPVTGLHPEVMHEVGHDGRTLGQAASEAKIGRLCYFKSVDSSESTERDGRFNFITTSDVARHAADYLTNVLLPRAERTTAFREWQQRGKPWSDGIVRQYKNDAREAQKKRVARHPPNSRAVTARARRTPANRPMEMGPVDFSGFIELENLDEFPEMGQQHGTRAPTNNGYAEADEESATLNSRDPSIASMLSALETQTVELKQLKTRLETQEEKFEERLQERLHEALQQREESFQQRLQEQQDSHQRDFKMLQEQFAEIHRSATEASTAASTAAMQEQRTLAQEQSRQQAEQFQQLTLQLTGSLAQMVQGLVIQQQQPPATRSETTHHQQGYTPAATTHADVQIGTTINDSTEDMATELSPLTEPSGSTKRSAPRPTVQAETVSNDAAQTPVERKKRDTKSTPQTMAALYQDQPTATTTETSTNSAAGSHDTTLFDRSQASSYDWHEQRDLDDALDRRNHHTTPSEWSPPIQDGPEESDSTIRERADWSRYHDGPTPTTQTSTTPQPQHSTLRQSPTKSFGYLWQSRIHQMGSAVIGQLTSNPLYGSPNRQPRRLPELSTPEAPSRQTETPTSVTSAPAGRRLFVNESDEHPQAERPSTQETSDIEDLLATQLDPPTAASNPQIATHTTAESPTDESISELAQAVIRGTLEGKNSNQETSQGAMGTRESQDEE